MNAIKLATAQAISMSVQQIHKTRQLMVSVPVRRKVQAVKGAIELKGKHLSLSGIASAATRLLSGLSGHGSRFAIDTNFILLPRGEY